MPRKNRRGREHDSRIARAIDSLLKPFRILYLAVVLGFQKLLYRPGEAADQLARAPEDFRKGLFVLPKAFVLGLKKLIPDALLERGSSARDRVRGRGNGGEPRWRRD